MKPRRLPLGGDSKRQKTPEPQKTSASRERGSGDSILAINGPSSNMPSTGTSSHRSKILNRGLPVSRSSRESTKSASPTVLSAQGSAVQDVENSSKPEATFPVEPPNNTGSTQDDDKVNNKEGHNVDGSQRARTESMGADAGAKLLAVGNDGRIASVSILLQGKAVSLKELEMLTSKSQSRLGNDGNQFNCNVCGGFGDVVCCDGCPRVYHPKCLPVGEPARVCLENNDDPWYCPKCISTKGSSRPRRVEKVDRKSSHHRCVDCQTVRANLALEPCEECGNYVHFPSCSGAEKSSPTQNRVLCSTCRAVDELTREEEELHNTKERSMNDDEATATRDDGVAMEEEEEDANDEEDDEEEDDENGNDTRDETAQSTGDFQGDNHTSKKRKRKISNKKEKLERKNKKKKKTPRKPTSPDLDAGSLEAAEPEAMDDTIQSPRRVLALAQATPAFYFYLAENRWKIERILARNHRYFNRLPKGSERNELVSKEAARWWVKLRPTDHRRYMNMSMRDFESRIIEWKEEKNLRDMIAEESDNEAGDVPEEEVVDAVEAEDERLTLDRHQRLLYSTSVGSKPFKPEPDQSYNRVLLDLLHDNRFHPLPMFCVNRSDTDTVVDEPNARATIPHFEVHGPVATSIGDECLGCSRGWTHFCPVLQRRVSAIEQRARLQPPLSSLAATRVGLGLRPRRERFLEPESKTADEELFVWKETEESTEMRNLLILPSATLSEVSERFDDIVQFIDETTAMKIPEPSSPDPSESPPKKAQSVGRLLPTTQQRRKEEATAFEAPLSYNKCGRCRTIIENETGCVQCRRAQLVINMSKRQPAGSPTNPNRQKGEGKLLKVHTAMLGRVQTKEITDVVQWSSDIAVSSAILKERWAPCAVLPPMRLHVPGDFSRKGSLDAQNPNAELEDEEDGESTESDDHSSPGEEGGQGLESEEQDSTEAAKEAEIDDPQGKRRSMRNAVSVTATDRQEVARRHKKEADELNKRTVTIACYGILLALLRRDPLKLFAQPVAAEGYSKIVKSPIDFGKIRSNVLAGSYSSLGAFVSDARLLCENALIYNPPASIYWKTAKEMNDLLSEMQRRASDWIGAVKDAHASFLLRKESSKRKSDDDDENDVITESDPFDDLSRNWPDAAELLESGELLRMQLEADFMRTQENETAYYGTLAVRRAAAAAQASLAPYSDSVGTHGLVGKRTHVEDEALRQYIDKAVTSHHAQLLQLKDISSWREEAVVRLMRKVQSRRLERRTISESGCSRCVSFDQETLAAMTAESIHHGRSRKKGEMDIPRFDLTRVHLTTGLASEKTCAIILNRENQNSEASPEVVNDACVSVRGSKIHGMGLFADQPFKKGDVVAEYIGEYISNPVAEAREKAYREQRIQDYQFRLNDKMVIDATLRGGPGRYINHNCSPNCLSKIVPSEKPNEHLKRVLLIAQRDIDINEEITYDYQFPLELDLSARIPCNCQSDACRGFMNWDLPEKGGNNRALLVQKRGANMRDRIRRLGRPLKRDEM